MKSSNCKSVVRKLTHYICRENYDKYYLNLAPRLRLPFNTVQHYVLITRYSRDILQTVFFLKFQIFLEEGVYPIDHTLDKFHL